MNKHKSIQYGTSKKPFREEKYYSAKEQTKLSIVKLYKFGLMEATNTNSQRLYIKESFPRWYMLCSKTDLFPNSNIVRKNDLVYANHIKGLNFNIEKYMAESVLIHNFYKYLRKNAIGVIYSLEPFHTIINSIQFGKLQELYCGKSKNFYIEVDKLVERYDSMGITNLQLAVPPVFNAVELFGSPLNVNSSEYCSVFKQDEVFSSMGSYWDYSFHRDGIYIGNPPFDEEFINRFSFKIISDLRKTIHRIIVVIILPDWEDQYLGYKRIKTSPFTKEYIWLDKDTYPYWDYYNQKIINISNTNLLILTNTNATFYNMNFDSKHFLNLWTEFTSKQIHVSDHANKQQP